MFVFGAGVIATIVKAQCPKCGSVQARARAPAGTMVDCTNCRASFLLEEGVALAEKRPA